MTIHISVRFHDDLSHDGALLVPSFGGFSLNYFLNDKASSKGGKIKNKFILTLCTSHMYGSQYSIAAVSRVFLGRHL